MTEKRDYHHGDLKAVILGLGMDALEAGGLEALSLRELAAKAGVSKTAPYRHFTDKQDLLGAMSALGFRILADRMESALARETEDKEVLRALGKVYLDAAIERPQLFRLMFSSMGMKLDSTDCQVQGERAMEYLSMGTARAQNAGYCHGQSLEAAVIQAWAHIHGLAGLILEGFVPKDILDGPLARDLFVKY